jgi:biopolymer transport protein TolQ
MGLTTLLAQTSAPTTALDMVFEGTLPTKLILGVLAVASATSWVLILWKAKQFRAVRRQGSRFLEKMERATGLADAYKAVLTLPESPYIRVFRQGLNFFSELRPGALREGAPPSEGLSLTQLQVLKLVLEKEEAEERDELAEGLIWLAVLGSVSPLMGLMGTVLGITDTFLGIASAGSSNIGAVAPGVAAALITTVAGLFVAIPAIVAYNHFLAKLNVVSGELEGFSSEFIGTLAREGRV